MIVYFSATGNSKYVVQRIAKATSETAVSMGKKLLSALIASILCLSMAGCGQTANTPPVDETPTQSEGQTTPSIDSVT